MLYPRNDRYQFVKPLPMLHNRRHTVSRKRILQRVVVRLTRQFVILGIEKRAQFVESYEHRGVAEQPDQSLEDIDGLPLGGSGSKNKSLTDGVPSRGDHSVVLGERCRVCLIATPNDLGGPPVVAVEPAYGPIHHRPSRHRAQEWGLWNRKLFKVQSWR